MASADFNPYLKWLGIRSDAPDHYQLLGIERFEDDADVIGAAADRQMAHVRKYQNGPHSSASQQLLNELAAAKLTLLAGDRKSAYDASLHRNSAQQQSANRTMRSLRVAAWCLAGLCLVGLAAAAFWIAGVQRQAPLETAETAADDPRHIRDTQPVAMQPKTQDVQPAVRQPVGRPADDTQVPQELPAETTRTPPLVTVIDMPPEAPSAAQAFVAKAPWSLARSKRRPARRPFPGKKHAEAKLLHALYDSNQELADKQIGRVRAQADSYEARLDAIRLEVLYWKFTEFWQKVDLGLERSGPGAELMFLGQPVSVAAKSAQTLTLRASNGETKQFDLVRQKMDPDLAIALARANGKTDGPMLGVMIAVFLATDRRGDLDQAKPLLDEARAAGIPVEVLLAGDGLPSGGLTMSAADDPARTIAAASDIESEVTPALAATSGNGRDEPSETLEHDVAARLTSADEPITAASDAEQVVETPQKQSPPTEADRKEKQRMLREVYRDLYAAPSNGRLAKRLLSDAHRTKDDPASRFTMYMESIRLASESGDVQTVTSAIRALAHHFSVDEHEIRLTSFKQLRRNVQDAERAAFCQVLMDNGADSLQDDNFQRAIDYLDVAQSAARSFRETKLLSQISQAKRRVEHLQSRYEELAPQRSLIAGARTGDSLEIANAHLAVGRFLAFEKGDFRRGAEHLALSEDQRMTQLAVLELANPVTAVEQLALADLWWQVSESDPDFTAAHQRAAYWYGAALPNLQGVSAKRAATRMQSANSKYSHSAL